MPLSPEQIARYRRDGYLLVKGALSPAEAAMYRQEASDIIDRVSRTRNVDATWGSAKADKPTKLAHCHDVQFESAAFARLIVDERITSVFAELMGTPNVQLHHTKLFIKPPENGSPFPMHQDKPFFPHDNDTMMAAIVHFDNASEEKGCVRVIPGTHTKDLEHRSEGGYHLDPETYPVMEATPCPAEPGDVLFFHYMLVHGSGVNVSDEARTTILIQVRDPEDPPSIATHESRGQGMMLAGVNPRTVDTKASTPAAPGAMGTPAMGGVPSMGGTPGMGGAPGMGG